jgi:hypothetical protein
VTVLLTEIFNFVAEQFGALLNVGVGLLTFLVFSARLRDRRDRLTDGARSGGGGLSDRTGHGGRGSAPRERGRLKCRQ